MKNLTVHVLKPAHLDSGHAEDAFRVAQQAPGPLTYELVDWDFDLPMKVVAEHWMQEGLPRYRERPSWGSIWNSVRNQFGAERLDEMEQRQPLEPAQPSRSLTAAMRHFERLGGEYRRTHAVPEDDLVIFLTTQGTFENFLVLPSFSGKRVGSIQLNHPVMQAIPSHLIVGYYLFALPILLLAYADESLESYLLNHAHQEVHGCLNDLCQDDVRTLLLKTKTADVCTRCKHEFKKRNLDWDLVRQMRNGFEVVRQLQLNLEDFLDGYSVPNMTLGLRIEFKDLGIAIPLSPKEAAVYEAFVEAGLEGIPLHDLDQHRDQLHDAYAKRYTGSNREDIIRVVNRLIDPSDPDLQQVISKVNRKFKAALGERCADFLISGKKGQPKRVEVARHHIRRA